MFTDSVVLSLYFETPLHAASGSAIGPVDHPIQRERATLWPLIHATTIEASLRSAVGDETAAKLFGEGDAGGSALSVGDARLLLFPARCSAAPFVWVSCPSALARLRRDLARTVGKEIPTPPAIKSDEILVTASWVGGDDPVAVEDVVLKPRKGFDPSVLLAMVPSAGPGYEGFDKQMEGTLALVADEVFSFLARTAVEIEPVSGEEGSAVYAEAVPADALFYVPLMGVAAKSKGKKKDATPLATLEKSLGTHLRVGGGERFGRGWARMAILKAEGGSQ